MTLLALLLACGSPAPAPGPSATPAPDRAAWAPAPAEWAKVPLAEALVGSAQAATEPLPAWRNAKGDIACPVMGMGIRAPDEAVSYADHEGVRYFFCCDSCEKAFVADPAAYAEGRYVADHALDPTAASCEEGKTEGH